MPSLSVGVDEFTLILQSTDKVMVMDWADIVNEIIDIFLVKSLLMNLFGDDIVRAEKVPAGYTNGLTFDCRPWYLVISWHDDFPSMGICVRFSAHAYASYKEEFKKQFQIDVNIATFLQMIQQNNIYTTRLSRIDLTADYYDYTDDILPNRPFCPDLIYERLKDGSYMVCNWKDRQSVRNMSALDKDGAYETVYIGSRKGKTNGYLRIYDKKQEQIQTMGYRYDEAIQHKSWVRFEASFLHDYAHQMTEQLLSGYMTPQDLQQWIAKHISDRYRFVDTSTNEVTAFTDDLIGISVGTNAAALIAPSPRDNTFRQSLEHLRVGSGLYPVLYKAFGMWGDGADRQLIEYLYDDYVYDFKIRLLKGKDEYKLREMRLWLQKHGAETAKYPLESYLDRSRHEDINILEQYED